MKKLIFIIFLYPFVSFSQWTYFTPESAGSLGSLIVTSKNNYYYKALNKYKGINTLYFTNNGGKLWQEREGVNNPVFINDSVGFGDLFYKKRGFANLIKLGRTMDYAYSWPDSFNIMPDSSFFAETTTNKNDVIITFPEQLNSTCLVTDNGTRIIKVCDKSLFKIHFINDTIGYGLDKNNFSIYKTSNGGHNWFLINKFTGTYGWSAFQFTSENIGYALLQYPNIILKTTNGGISWDTLPKLLDVKSIMDIDFINDSIGFAFCHSIINDDFKFTLDGGKTWKRLCQRPPIGGIMKILTDQDSIYFFFWAEGAGYSSLYKGSFAFKDILAGMSEKPIINKNKYISYPNPSDGLITVKCEGELPCIGRLELMNLQGQVLYNQNIYKPENVIDISTFSKGIFIVKVLDEMGVWVSKVVKE